MLVSHRILYPLIVINDEANHLRGKRKSFRFMATAGDPCLHMHSLVFRGTDLDKVDSIQLSNGLSIW